MEPHKRGSDDDNAGAPPSIHPHVDGARCSDGRTTRGYLEASVAAKRKAQLQCGDDVGFSADIASSLRQLAHVCHQEGDYKAARNYYMALLSMMRRVHGGGGGGGGGGSKDGSRANKDAVSGDLAQVLNNLGNCCRAQGDLRSCREYLQASLDMHRQLHGGEHAIHVDIAAVLNNLGILFSVAKNYRVAREYHEASLAMSRKMYGEDAMNTAIAVSLGNLGNVSKAQGAYKQARLYHEAALDIKRRVSAVLGGADVEGNSNLAHSLNNLASAYEAEGDLEKALPLFQEALALQSTVASATHPTTRLMKRNLDRTRAQKAVRECFIL
jgi:Tfp pilus assembly protein PilF